MDNRPHLFIIISKRGNEEHLVLNMSQSEIFLFFGFIKVNPWNYVEPKASILDKLISFFF